MKAEEGEIVGLKWVANCSKCNAKGQFICEGDVFKRHVKTTGPKKRRMCGYFKENPRLTMDSDTVILDDVDDEEDEGGMFQLRDKIFVVLDLVEGGVQMYKVGRVSDYEYSAHMCSLEMFEYFPAEGK
jgi:hypothetical protein